MVERKTPGEVTLNVFITVIMVFLALIMLYPMLYEIFVSFSEPLKLFRHRGLLFAPAGFRTYAYEWVLSDKEIWTG